MDNLLTINGKAQMVSALDTISWHGKETRVEKMNPQECFVWSGHSAVAPVMQDITGLNGEIIPTHKALYNMGTEKPTLIAVHGSGYTPAMPWEMYEYFAPMLEKMGGRYVTAGIIGNYEKMWALAEFGERFTFNVGKGDNPVKKYFLSGIGYDGTQGQFWGDTDIQVVCQNTLRRALNIGGINKFRQTKNRRANVISQLSADAILAKMEADMQADKENMGILASTEYTNDMLKIFVETMFPKTKEELTPAVIETREKFSQALEVAPGIKAGQTQGTLFSLIDAITYLMTHYRLGIRKDTDSLANDLFGSAQKTREEALACVWKMV